jgi:hypothetical protein
MSEIDAMMAEIAKRAQRALDAENVFLYNWGRTQPPKLEGHPMSTEQAGQDTALNPESKATEHSTDNADKPKVEKITAERVREDKMTATSTQIQAQLTNIANALDIVFISIDRDPKLALMFWRHLASLERGNYHTTTRVCLFGIAETEIG